MPGWLVACVRFGACRAEIVRAKEVIASGKIGDVVTARSHYYEYLADTPMNPTAEADTHAGAEQSTAKEQGSEDASETADGKEPTANFEREDTGNLVGNV